MRNVTDIARRGGDQGNGGSARGAAGEGDGAAGGGVDVSSCEASSADMDGGGAARICYCCDVPCLSASTARPVPPTAAACARGIVESLARHKSRQRAFLILDLDLSLDPPHRIRLLRA